MWRKALSLAARGARYHLGIAMALITVIPALALFYLIFVELSSGEQMLFHRPLIAGILIVSVVLGYALLSKYPVNIIRLRRYMEDIVNGRLPDKVRLVESMDDIGAIERSMNLIIEQLSGRLTEMESEIERRQRAERLKDDFVSTVSHELRTPLAIAKEGISLLLDGIPGQINEKQGKVLTATRGNIDRLARLINDLLDISKIEAGKMQLRRGRMDMARLAAQAAASLRPLAARKELTIETRVAPGPIDAFADEDRILQVLTNLIGNAVKFTQHGGVTVSVSATDSQIECAVSDTGPGIQPDDMPKLFGKFMQFGRVNGAGEKGTGLGLAIVKSIVELHGGQVTAESTPGQGTTFAFTIPRHTEDVVVRSLIEEKIVEARKTAATFTVFLFQLAGGASAVGDDLKEALRKGFLRLQEAKSLARGSDSLNPRSDRELVLVADAKPEHAESIAARWREAIEGYFREEAPKTAMLMACGYACFPKDADSTAALLQAAEHSLRERGSAPPGSGERPAAPAGRPDRGTARGACRSDGDRREDTA